jgi:hypothetical protein
VRLVVAGEDVARVLVLALRPHLPRAIAHVLVGRQEVHAPHGLGRVAHHEPALSEIARQRHLERLTVVGEREALFARVAHQRDALDVEVHGVELHGLGVGVDALELEARHAHEALLVDHEREIEREVADAEGARALVDALRAREREGPRREPLAREPLAALSEGRVAGAAFVQAELHALSDVAIRAGLQD